MNIDLNADVGEGADDAPLYEVVSSVNIACGAHAGDDDSMARAIELGLKTAVSIGAHPGYPDRENLGRKPLAMHKAELRASIRDQIARLRRIAADRSATVSHVKPHGALYNEAAVDPWLATTITDAIGSLKPKPRLIALSGSWLAAAGRSASLLVADEGFADRRYKKDGTLAPRTQSDALITDPAVAAEQALALARGLPIESVDGRSVTIHASSICVHADTPGAVENARAVRAALEQAGFTIAPLGRSGVAPRHHRRQHPRHQAFDLVGFGSLEHDFDPGRSVDRGNDPFLEPGEDEDHEHEPSGCREDPRPHTIGIPREPSFVTRGSASHRSGCAC